MEQLITYAIYFHAFLGGVGLITGIGNMMVKKGGRLHKKMGKLFSIGMIGSSLIILLIAWLLAGLQVLSQSRYLYYK